MSAYDLATAQSMLARYLAAETAVLGNQEYEIEGRRLKRADLAEIQAGRDKWAGIIAKLERAASGKARTRYAVLG